jgi:DNA topoisomerase-1
MTQENDIYLWMGYSLSKLKKLVLVESPAKAKTIQGYLGSDFKVVPTGGHLLDLPIHELGVDIQNDFKIQKIPIIRNQKRIPAIVKEIQACDSVYVATDPDREGEAIAFDIRNLGKLKKNQNWFRVGFHEITELSIREKILNPDEFNIQLAEAQETRRILDRLFGYLISPVLWKKLNSGLSAGRVQSVVLRWICEREESIQKFIPEKYFLCSAIHNDSKKDICISFQYIQPKDKFEIPAQLFKKLNLSVVEEDQKIEIKEKFKVESVTEKDSVEYPKPPFQTSTLQEYCSNIYHFPPKKTMKIAQTLFEGISLDSGKREGLITYPRTDSTRLSAKAISEGLKIIQEKYGKEFVGQYKSVSKGKVQDAHEAIRPTKFEITPDISKKYLSSDEQKVYESIYIRFLQSLANPRKGKKIKTILSGLDSKWEREDFEEKFPGFKKLEIQSKKNPPISLFKKGESVLIQNIEIAIKFTEPPSRYTYASIIQKMEKTGVGRPSTYVQAIETLNERNYIIWNKRVCEPTDIGIKVYQFLNLNFQSFIQDDFTKNLEIQLDEIQLGTQNKLSILKEFYDLLKNKINLVPKEKFILENQKKCPICNLGSVQTKRDRKGKKILYCSRYPECEYGEYV